MKDDIEGINLTFSSKVILKELYTFITRLVYRPVSSLNLHKCVSGKSLSVLFESSKNGIPITLLIFHRNLNRLQGIIWGIVHQFLFFRPALKNSFPGSEKSSDHISSPIKSLHFLMGTGGWSDSAICPVFLRYFVF